MRGPSFDLSATLAGHFERAGRGAQTRAAIEMGVDPSSLQAWCSGRRRVDKRNLPALASVLGISVRELIQAPEPEPDPDPESPHAAPIALVPKPPGAFGAYLKQSALEQAGMTRLAEDRPVYECYCLLCGRGLGRNGVLVQSHHPPCQLGECATCRGAMFCRRVDDCQVERLMRDPIGRTGDEKWRLVA